MTFILKSLSFVLMFLKCDGLVRSGKGFVRGSRERARGGTSFEEVNSPSYPTLTEPTCSFEISLITQIMTFFNLELFCIYIAYYSMV